MLIAVDGGKDSTKSIARVDGELKENSFRSRFYNITDLEEVEEHGKNYRVVFEGNEYLVGDSGTDYNPSTDKADDYNKICQYIAITQFIEPNKKEDIQLITGFPTQSFQNKQAREEYKRNLLGDKNGYIEIMVDGENYEFNITDISIRPEGSGITAIRPNLFKGKNVNVVDLGGQNSNMATYLDLAPTPKAITRNHGGNTLEKSIENGLHTSLGVENITTPMIRTYIKNGSGNTEVDNLISSHINRYVNNNIKQELLENGFDIKLTDTVFIGGTSYAYRDYIREVFPKGIFMDTLEDSQFANVRGFYKMGEVMYEK